MLVNFSYKVITMLIFFFEETMLILNQLQLQFYTH